MSARFNENDSGSGASANVIAIAGLNLALSYENAAVERLGERNFFSSFHPKIDQIK